MKKLASAFDWEIQERELIIGNVVNTTNIIVDRFSDRVTPTFKAIVNGSTGDVLSIPKHGYTRLYNSKLEEAAHMMAKASNGVVEGFDTFQGGRKVLAFIKAENHKGKINKNTINDYIVIGNSNDGTSAIFIGTSTTLVRCANQFASIQRDFKIRHTGEIAIKFEEALQHYKQYYAQKELMYSKFKEMSKVKIDIKLINSLTDRLFDIDRIAIAKEKIELSTRKQNQLIEFSHSLDREMTDLGSNLWGFFNGVTHYTTHVRNKTNSDNNSFGNVVGNSANFNDKAITLITQHLKTA